MNPPVTEREFPLADYALDATLDSGQAFRWERRGEAWEGILGQRWVRLRQDLARGVLVAHVAQPEAEWRWLTDYLQLDVNLPEVLATFPRDLPLQAAVEECRGLRLLRQDPWECLASFVLSSTKQIVQIRQIVAALAQGLGEPVAVPAGGPPAHAFPAPWRVAEAGEETLRGFKMGFRARYLLGVACAVAHEGFDLEALRSLSLSAARARLVELPGVGPKIADCVLLFAYGFAEAFPVDVWVMRALQELYFPRRRPRPARIREFAATYFLPQAGYAQQYLFHAMRARAGKVASRAGLGQPVGR